MNRKAIFLALGLLSLNAAAEELSFPKVWGQIEPVSAAQDSARLMAESASEAHARASRHWLPKLYIDARSYKTNDPAQAFMGVLEQRSIQQADFVPNSLNHPEARTYSRAALGLDLPLYQGGAGVAMEQISGSALAAKTEESEQVKVDQYAEVARAYGTLAALGRGVSGFREMQSEVERLRKGYRLGSKSNPVGYSGALGMTAVANKLAALIQQYSAMAEAHRSEIRELGLASTAWSPEPVSVLDFSDRFLAANSSAAVSHRAESIQAKAEMSGQAVSLERSKGLPQLGLFAEGYGFNGNRDTATGYSAGLYLRWNLFNPSDFGSTKEAKLQAAGAERFAEAFAQEERAAKSSLEANLRALRLNLGIFSETEKVLKEQSWVTESLFRNGSLNALQFVEVVNRRADLAAQRLEAELAYLKAASQALGKQKVNIAELTGK